MRGARERAGERAGRGAEWDTHTGAYGTARCERRRQACVWESGASGEMGTEEERREQAHRGRPWRETASAWGGGGYGKRREVGRISGQWVR